MIREKAQEGKSAYAIAKETGLSKNTVKKYIAPAAVCMVDSARNNPSKLDDHKDTIYACMKAGIFNCETILERIQGKGYTGSITILKDFVKPFRPAKSLPAVPRYESMPGKQAQMDYGICHYLDLDGVIHKAPAFIMIMGFSRAKYVEFVKRCDLYSLERCLVNAFEYFGGVPETILTDRMKTVVIGTEGGQTIWNTKFQEFARDMGFIPKLCKARRPQTKGKVERLVSYVKDNFLPGRTFTDLSDLNLQAINWCRKVDSKIHGTTGLIPIKELMTLSFASRKENVIFLRPPGVGKSHLSVALGMEAIKSGLTVYFVSVADLVRDLKRAEAAGKLESRWKIYLRTNLLILDEIGYSQLDRGSAELLFQLISKRYETGSLIMNSNKNFSSWGEILGDAVMATAILDRLLHHCTVINIRGGETYRLKDRKKAGILTVPPADIPAFEIPALE